MGTGRDLDGTVEPQFNVPLFNENLDAKKGVLCPSKCKLYEKEPWYYKPSIYQTNLASLQRLH